MTAWSLADWSLDPGVLACVALVGGAYAVGLKNLRPRTVWDEHIVAMREIASFAGGLALLLVALVSPLDTLGVDLLSAHVAQHLILLYLVPPLILLGIPAWLIRPALRWPGARLALRILTRPSVAVATFLVVSAAWHLPVLWDAALVSGWLHAFEHLCFLGAGFMAWWPIFSPLPESPRMSYPAQLVYLLLLSFIPGFVGVILLFSSTVIYPPYLATPRLLGFTPLLDQRVAGLLIKFVGTLFLWALATVRFFQWFYHDEHEVEKLADDRTLHRER